MDERDNEKLDIIIEKMDLLIQILTSKSQIPEDVTGKTQIDILELCNMENSPSEMMQKLNLSKKSVEMALSRLRKNNIIKSIKTKNKTVYLRLK
ncbi:hypothetical protein KKF86_05240 [bacterium]|nr:hypothetical protein [bacterium]